MTMTRTEYTALMAEGEAGTKIEQSVFDETKAFAQAKRIKQPKTDWILTAPAPKAPKAPKAPRAKKVPVDCKRKDCDRPSRAGGECTMHYAQTYRSDPAKADKAREAAKNYAARQRQAKKDAEAQTASEVEAA